MKISYNRIYSPQCNHARLSSSCVLRWSYHMLYLYSISPSMFLSNLWSASSFYRVSEARACASRIPLGLLKLSSKVRKLRRAAACLPDTLSDPVKSNNHNATAGPQTQQTRREALVERAQPFFAAYSHHRRPRPAVLGQLPGRGARVLDARLNDVKLCTRGQTYISHNRA